MRIRLGEHPAHSHGKLRAAIVGHGRLCSMSGEQFGLNVFHCDQRQIIRKLILTAKALDTGHNRLI